MNYLCHFISLFLLRVLVKPCCELQASPIDPGGFCSHPFPVNWDPRIKVQYLLGP